jgi:hypothetical protein
MLSIYGLWSARSRHRLLLATGKYFVFSLLSALSKAANILTLRGFKLILLRTMSNNTGPFFAQH